MKKAPLLLLLLPGLAMAGARVSNLKVDSKLGKSFYAGNAAIDGKLDTVWMVPGESENKGEWIELEIPKGEVDKIAIYPGNGKSDEAFHDYARVKQMRVDVYAVEDDQSEKQVGSATVDVADKAELQVIDIPDIKDNEGLFGGKVKLTVLDVYDGDDFPNLAVAEVMVVLKEFDPPKPPVISEVTGTVDGHGPEMMMDANPKTFWAADAASAGFSLESDSYGMSSIGFVAQGKDYARPKTVDITVGQVTRRTVLPDTPGEQRAEVPGFNGYNGGGFGALKIKIVDTYPGTNPQVGVQEIKIHASNYSAI